MASEVMDRLLMSDEPSVRWKVRAEVLGEPHGSPAQIRQSPRVNQLLANRDKDGRSTVAVKPSGPSGGLSAL